MLAYFFNLFSVYIHGFFNRLVAAQPIVVQSIPTQIQTLLQAQTTPTSYDSEDFIRAAMRGDVERMTYLLDEKRVDINYFSHLVSIC